MNLLQRNLIAGIIGIGFGLTVGAGGLNYLSHGNEHYKTKNRETFEDVDGFYNHTLVDIDLESGFINIDRSKGIFGEYSGYGDYDANGIIDYLFVSGRIPESGSYSEEDLKKPEYNSLFRQAQTDYETQLERFGVRPRNKK